MMSFSSQSLLSILDSYSLQSLLSDKQPHREPGAVPGTQ